MWIQYLGLLLLALLVQGETQCKSGDIISLGNSCQTYLECINGSIKLTDCPNGFALNVTLKTCIQQTKSKPEDCNTNNWIINLVFHPSSDKINALNVPDRKFWPKINNTYAASTKEPVDKESFENNYWPGTDNPDVTETEWPVEKITTEGNYWPGTDNPDVTGTEWPVEKITTEGNYWPGTDNPDVTGTEWPVEKITTNEVLDVLFFKGKQLGELISKRLKRELSTDSDYWTGTDNPTATGTEWPSPTYTTKDNFWTGTDGTGGTATDFTSFSVTTDGGYWTGTDGTGMTGTEWPSFSSTPRGSSHHFSPVTYTSFPTDSSSISPFTQEPHTNIFTVTQATDVTQNPSTDTSVSFITETESILTDVPWTVTESSNTHAFSTEVFTSETITFHTEPYETPTTTVKQSTTSPTTTTKPSTTSKKPTTKPTSSVTTPKTKKTTTAIPPWTHHPWTGTIWTVATSTHRASTGTAWGDEQLNISSTESSWNK